jgi:hypothetical protein
MVKTIDNISTNQLIELIDFETKRISKKIYYNPELKNSEKDFEGYDLCVKLSVFDNENPLIDYWISPKGNISN